MSRITEALLPPEPSAPAATSGTSVSAAAPAARIPVPADGQPRRTAQPLPPEQPAPPARPVRPAPGDETPTETTTRLRPVRDDRRGPATAAPRPGTPARSPGPEPVRDGRQAPFAGAAPRPGTPARPAGLGAVHDGDRSAPEGLPPAVAPAYAYDAWALRGGVPDETPAETTTRLRPIRERATGRVVAAAVCAVLALGLVGGALIGAVLAGTGAGEPAEPAGFSRARTLWHDAPVDTLFPRTLSGPAAGPGGATRTWSRIVVAPDAPCSPTTLPRALHTALATVGCDRVLRATYTDATSSHVVTVALVFTQADPATMRTLGSRAADEPAPALAASGTVAARFGDRQRASWWRHVLPDLPVVVTAVSGFADGRVVAEPEPAERAMTPKRDTAVAQAGLGHEARGAAEAVERALRATATAPAGEDER
ncbi:hypothetical protein [Streptomyces roseicoloratus]|uniref:hypothetical protein n=1 Tax=Streptomyces roseicoloratus TaxID=2508722 RepID=UPI001FE7934B|nr:hypothetical protein [Streptomyces roseicoloratus]